MKSLVEYPRHRIVVEGREYHRRTYASGDSGAPLQCAGQPGSDLHHPTIPAGRNGDRCLEPPVAEPMRRAGIGRGGGTMARLPGAFSAPGRAGGRWLLYNEMGDGDRLAEPAGSLLVTISPGTPA